MRIPLKELRKTKNITQAILSKALNVSPSAVGMWEQGYREPDFENLKRIADYFGVTTDYLLGREGELNKPPLSAEQEKLIKDFTQLSKDNKRLVLKVVGAFLTQQAAAVFGSVNNNGSGNFFANNGDVYA